MNSNKFCEVINYGNMAGYIFSLVVHHPSKQVAKKEGKQSRNPINRVIPLALITCLLLLPFLNLSDAQWWDSGSTAFSRREDHRLQFSVTALISDPRCKDCSQTRGGKRETITDQMQAVYKATQGRDRSNKRSLLRWSEDVSEAAVFTHGFQYLHTKHNIFGYLFEKLHVNDQTSILLWIALRSSS